MEARRSFEDVFQEHREEVQRLIARHTKNPDDALDLTQEVFIRAYGAFSQFRGESSISTWLYRIAVNVCSNFARSKANHDEEPVEDLDSLRCPQGLRDIVEDLAHAEEQRMIKCALRSLSAEQLVALSLRYSDQLTIPEIAEVVGAPVDTIKSRLRTALDKVHSTLAFLNASIARASQFPIAEDIMVSLESAPSECEKGAKIHHGLGSLYLKKGLVEAALLEWKKAQTIEPTFLEPYLASAEQYIKSERPEKAIDTLEAAVGKIQSPDLHTGLAGVYLDIGDLEEGLSHALRALDLQPRDPQAHYVAGRAYSKRADLQDALQSLSTGNGFAPTGLKGTWRDAARHFQQAIELKPDFGKARSTLAITYLRNSMTDEALREIDAAVNESEDDFILYQAGWFHYKASKLDLAERHIKHSLSMRLTADKLHLLGKIHTAQDRPEEAFDAFNQALQSASLNPNKKQMPNIYCDLAATAIRLDRLDEAIEACEAAIRIEPNHVNAKCNLCDACLRKGMNPHYVIRLSREALQTAPEHICFHRYLAEAFLRDGQYQEALPEATIAVELEPEDAERWLLRARVLAKLHETEEAQRCLATALELDTDDQVAQSLGELIQQCRSSTPDDSA